MHHRRGYLVSMLGAPAWPLDCIAETCCLIKFYAFILLSLFQTFPLRDCISDSISACHHSELAFKRTNSASNSQIRSFMSLVTLNLKQSLCSTSILASKQNQFLEREAQKNRKKAKTTESIYYKPSHHLLELTLHEFWLVVDMSHDKVEGWIF